MIRNASRSLALLAFLPLLAACASGGAPAGDTATPAEGGGWEDLAEPRPEPLEGAPRVTVAEMLLMEERPWGLDAPIPTSLGLTELVAAGLLRRRDVQFVERLRFSRAAEQERVGASRPAGAPPVGTSPGAEWLLLGSVAPLGDSIYLDLRLVHTETGTDRTSWRTAVPRSSDPTALARTVVGSLVERLGELDLVPAWDDPIPSAAPFPHRDTGIPAEAFALFMRGLAAEERYDWEGARSAYQEALRRGGPGFFEPAVALARTARLRSGGSLGTG